MMMRVGYEIDKLLVEPVEYWAHRLINGRRVEKYGPFATEEAARSEVEEQIKLDERR